MDIVFAVTGEETPRDTLLSTQKNASSRAADEDEKSRIRSQTSVALTEEVVFCIVSFLRRETPHPCFAPDCQVVAVSTPKGPP